MRLVPPGPRPLPGGEPLTRCWLEKIVTHPVSEARCPFCGAVKTYMGRPGGAWSLVCGTCGARGPLSNSSDGALEGFERRTEA